MASEPTNPSSFGELVFEYLKTVVPHWRLCDEAWLLGDDHLVGIGVERNYGGQMLIVPLSGGDVVPHQDWPDILPALEAAAIALDRVVVVLDDRAERPQYYQSTPFPKVLWSEREQLSTWVVRDTP